MVGSPIEWTRDAPASINLAQCSVKPVQATPEGAYQCPCIDIKHILCSATKWEQP